MGNTVTTLSPRLKALFDRGKLDKTFKDIGVATAGFLLGKAKRLPGDKKQSTMDQKQAPLRQGFGPWKSAGNKRTRTFSKYKSKAYENKKTDLGLKNFMMFSGDLFNDAINKAKVRATRNGFEVTVNKGKSSSYAAVHQFGSSKMPQRSYYIVDQKDEDNMAEFIQNRLIQAFSNEARIGKVV